MIKGSVGKLLGQVQQVGDITRLSRLSPGKGIGERAAVKLPVEMGPSEEMLGTWLSVWWKPRDGQRNRKSSLVMGNGKRINNSKPSRSNPIDTGIHVRGTVEGGLRRPTEVSHGEPFTHCTGPELRRGDSAAVHLRGSCGRSLRVAPLAQRAFSGKS